MSPISFSTPPFCTVCTSAGFVCSTLWMWVKWLTSADIFFSTLRIDTGAVSYWHRKFGTFNQRVICLPHSLSTHCILKPPPPFWRAKGVQRETAKQLFTLPVSLSLSRSTPLSYLSLVSIRQGLCGGGGGGGGGHTHFRRCSNWLLSFPFAVWIPECETRRYSSTVSRTQKRCHIQQTIITRIFHNGAIKRKTNKQKNMKEVNENNSKTISVVGVRQRSHSHQSRQWHYFQ